MFDRILNTPVMDTQPEMDVAMDTQPELDVNMTFT